MFVNKFTYFLHFCVLSGKIYLPVIPDNRESTVYQISRYNEGLLFKNILLFKNKLFKYNRLYDSKKLQIILRPVGCMLSRQGLIWACWSPKV